MVLDSKRKFFEAWNAGLLGFKLRTWDSYGLYVNDPQRASTVGLRQIGVAGGGKFEVGTGLAQVEEIVGRWMAEDRQYIICEAAPDHKALCQGEVVRTERGLEGYIGFSKMRMRDAIAAGNLSHRSWLQTEMILRANMWPSSREDLNSLLDLYPDHVVEFTCYDHRFEPGRNTIFWEVRKY